MKIRAVKLADRLNWFCTLRGYRRIFILLSLGCLLTLAFAPLFLWPLAIISLSGLFLLVQHSQNTKEAFWSGWWFGLGHFATGLYWFAHALLTDAEQFAWLIPFAVLGIPAVLAFYTACVTFLTSYLSKYPLQAWLAFAFLWLVAEFLRAHLFSGFPWNLLGYIWGVSDISIQSASIFGVWGLSLLAALLCTAPALLLTPQFKFYKPHLKYITPPIILFIILLGWGAMRLSENPINHNSAADSSFTIRLVQGNIAQPHKWDPARQMDIFRTYVELSKAPSRRPLSMIIWPESALPFLPQEQKWVRQVIGDAVPENAHLITGALRVERGQDESQSFAIWNSMFVFDEDGDIKAFYDKHHLVPFGEYIPLRTILPLKKITAGSVDFSQGQGTKTMRVDEIPPFSPLICYEVIFPDNVINSQDRPAWMVNITNDAWFGNSSGPHQHLHMARFRAVEQGIPLVRAANTGISGVIDSYGRIINHLPLGKKAILDITLPKPTVGVTMYQNRYGLYLFIIIYGCCFWATRKAQL